MPVTPYNTGKIKIGCHYIKPQVNMNTNETDFWQNVFIGEPRRVNVWLLFCVLFWIGFGFAVGYWGFQ